MLYYYHSIFLDSYFQNKLLFEVKECMESYSKIPNYCKFIYLQLLHYRINNKAYK